MAFLSRSLAFWIFMWGTHFSEGPVDHPSREDRLLLKEENSPKCFTRTENDFTCFWETEDNRTYDAFYNFNKSSAMRRCPASSRRTEDDTSLHVCSFPASDVHMFVDTNVKVMDSNTGRTIYSRTVSVEDHILLDQPFNVTLRQTDHVGELQVSWDEFVPKYWKEKVYFRIRHFSTGLGEKIKEGSRSSDDPVIMLVPGDEVQVQVSVKCGHNKDVGHWSSWSPAVHAVAPQSGDDISLVCFTVDLQMITCQWSSSSFGNKSQMFYKMLLSGWTDWTECLTESHVADRCSFNGSQSTKVKVRILASNRTFYAADFALESSIKPSPPAHVKGSLDEGRLCLKWDAPILSASTHLLYEVAHQTRRQKAWTISSLLGPLPELCLEVPAGTHYRVKVRAKPDGSIHSGHWSDWSEVLSGDTPAGTDSVAMMRILVSLLAVVVALALFLLYFKKLKQHVWPPVPNLDKVLLSFLAEIDDNKWELPVTAKQCLEETSLSVVEVRSREESSEPVEPPEEDLLPPRQEQVETGSGEGPFPEYVTLNRDGLVGNMYVCEEKGGPEIQGPESADTWTDFLNHSYSTQAARRPSGTSEAEPGNRYTNL